MQSAIFNSKIILLLLYSMNRIARCMAFFILGLGSMDSSAQSSAADYVKTVYGGELKGVKTAKVYYYNASFGDIQTSVSEKKYYVLRMYEQDKYGRLLYNLSIKPTENGADTNYGDRYTYEMDQGLLVQQHKYLNWPDTLENVSIQKTYTPSGQIKTEETTETNKLGIVISYKKIIYDYDRQNRLVQKRDSSTPNSFLVIYEQLITNYHYDTLGVKCYIEENKVQHTGFTEPVSRSYITDSINKTNRTYYYYLTGNSYIGSEYMQFDRNKNPIRHQRFRIWHEGDIFYKDSSRTKDILTTYDNKNRRVLYENKLEGLTVKYVYHTNGQLKERSSDHQKEYFTYDAKGNLVEYLEKWRNNYYREIYSDFNKLGIAETVTSVNEKGEINHMTKREFTYW